MFEGLGCFEFSKLQAYIFMNLIPDLFWKSGKTDLFGANVRSSPPSVVGPHGEKRGLERNTESIDSGTVF